MDRKLEYINKDRGGYVVYKDGEGELKLFFEYGAGNCVAFIYVPKVEEWPYKTSRTIAERNAILVFVAEQAIKDQAQGCYYVLSDAYIQIFTKEIP